MFSSLKYTLRLFRIALTLAQHDALFSLEAANIAPIVTRISRLFRKRRYRNLRDGQRLAMALESLGPTFIKLGQALSVRPDLVGEEVSNDLANLRDQLPPFDSAIAKQTIESQLGKPLSELFSAFDDKPVAAASIAQVHFATTPDGKEVAVKILRPDIHKAFARDMDLFFWLATQGERCLPKYRRLKFVETIETFARTIQFELDLRYEAAAADELRKNTHSDAGFYVPQVDWNRTSERVMTIERIKGISLGDAEALKAANIDFNKLVEIAATAFFRQVFRDGFFHADMHPGNIFVMPDNTLAVVDFGIMGRIDHATQLYLAKMLWAFLQKDYEGVARIHIDAGFVPRDTSVAEFAQANRAIAEPIFGKPLNEISIATLLGQLFQVAETFQMETQPKLLMLQKTMMLCEGVGRLLNPSVNMWKLAEPLIEQWAKQNFGAKQQIKNVFEEGKNALQKIPQLIAQTQHIVDSLDLGGIKLHPDTVQAMRGNSSTSNRWIWLATGGLLILAIIALELSVIVLR